MVSSNNASKKQMGFNSAFKGLNLKPGSFQYRSSKKKWMYIFQRTVLYESPGMWKNLGEGVKGDLNVGTAQLTKSKYLGEETFKSSRRDTLMVTYSKALGQL